MKSSNTLKKAIKVNLSSSSTKTLKNQLKKSEGDDLFRLKIADPLILDLKLFGLKNDLDIELYSPKKKLGKVLKAVGKTKFGKLRKKEINKHLRQVTRSKRKGKANESLAN